MYSQVNIENAIIANVWEQSETLFAKGQSKYQTAKSKDIDDSSIISS